MTERSRRRNRDLSDEDRVITTLTRSVGEGDVREDRVREERDRRCDRLMQKLRQDWRQAHGAKQS
jgi:hypothetical protein